MLQLFGRMLVKADGFQIGIQKNFVFSSRRLLNIFLLYSIFSWWDILYYTDLIIFFSAYLDGKQFLLCFKLNHRAKQFCFHYPRNHVKVTYLICWLCELFCSSSNLMGMIICLCYKSWSTHERMPINFDFVEFGGNKLKSILTLNKLSAS